jgi:hypothetical protein
VQTRELQSNNNNSASSQGNVNEIKGQHQLSRVRNFSSFTSGRDSLNLTEMVNLVHPKNKTEKVRDQKVPTRINGLTN